MLASAIAWMRAMRCLVGRLAEEVREALLRLEVLGHRHLAADGRARRDVAVVRLEQREQAALDREPRDLDRVLGRRAPSERARHEDVDVARAFDRHRVGDLRPRGRAGSTRSPSRRRECGAPWRCAARSCRCRTRCPARRRRPASWRCARPAAWRSSAARRCSCRPRCRSRCRARRRCARTCRTGTRSRCRWCRRRRPAR